MKKLIIFCIFFLLTIFFSSCAKDESLDEVSSKYVQFLTSIEEFALQQNTSPLSIRALAENNPDLLERNSFDGTYSFYTIQGMPLDTNENSIRETIAYKRLMGHMDYYTVIEEDAFATYFKVFDKPSVETGQINFLGIVKITVPFETFFKTMLADQKYSDKSFFFLDSNKIILLYPQMRTVSVGEDSNLQALVKKLSLNEKEEGEITLKEFKGKDTFYYIINDRSIVGIEVDR